MITARPARRSVTHARAVRKIRNRSLSSAGFTYSRGLARTSELLHAEPDEYGADTVLY